MAIETLPVATRCPKLPNTGSIKPALDSWSLGIEASQVVAMWVDSISKCDLPSFSAGCWQWDPSLGNTYDHLTSDEWELIFQLREAKMSVPEIDERLGRHRFTIRREIRCNWHDDAETAIQHWHQDQQPCLLRRYLTLARSITI